MPDAEKLSSEKMRTIGTKLTKIKSGTETTDWEIGSLLSIGDISTEAEEIDVTTLDSPDGAKEYMSGGTETSDIAISGIIKYDVDKDTPAKMLSLLASGIVESWKVDYPSGSKFEFNAYVKAFSMAEATTDGKLSYNATLKVSGKPTYTATTTN